MTQELTNWTDLDKDFTRKPWNKTYQELWQDQGFNYQQTKQYLSQGFKIADFMLLTWLQKQQINIEKLTNNEINNYRLTYQQAWIALDAQFADKTRFNLTYQQIWEAVGIDYQQARQ